MQDQDLRLAVLIDADNVPRRYIKAIMEEIAVYGNPTLKRIYGDWTTPNLSKWKDDLLENALTPIQQYGYTTGKNSTDSAMIIDAMDILYSGNMDGFCIVSSDSDFTRLAIRLREAGKKVIGLGERKTPSPFIVACDRFIYIEVLAKQAAPITPAPRPQPKRRVPAAAAPAPLTVAQTAAAAPAVIPAAPVAQPQTDGKMKTPIPRDIIEYISQTIEDIGDDDGWAYLGELGSLLQKKRPDFDSRNYGYKKLSSMVENCGEFEVDFRGNANNGKLIYVRVKR
ncbi:MAG: NYN domain-containing protein [Oscillospiraceae bacterium]|nr:NYN domain-containing protein [Oscillospiraceae bacterium]